MVSLRSLLIIVIILAIILVLPTFSPADNKKKQNSSTTSNTAAKKSKPISNTTQSENFTLVIDQLKISAPIILNVDGNNKAAYLSALESGVAHMANTPLSEQGGNMVIFGHSSYFSSKPGNFKTVFAKLDKLKVGSQIQIKNPSKTYTYIVIENKVVLPNDISAVRQDKTKQLLTLITCWPPGSLDKRRVVISRLNSFSEN